MSSLDRIKCAVVEVSEADEFEKAVLEWEPFAALVATRDRINDAECTCLCDKRGLKYLYLFRNRKTGERLANEKGRYVGSTCVRAFGVDEFNEYVNMFEGGGVTLPDLVDALERAYVGRGELDLWSYNQPRGKEFQTLLTSFTPALLKRLLIYDVLPHDVDIALEAIFDNPSAQLTVFDGADSGSANAAQFLHVMKREYAMKPGEPGFTSSEMGRVAFECVWDICYGDNGGGIRKWLWEHSVSIDGVTHYSITARGV